MPDESLLKELLVDYEMALDEGRQVTPEQLCPTDRPDLVEELRKRLARLEKVNGVFFPETAGKQRLSLSSPRGLPGFEFLEELGRGGMGVVYRAHDIRLKRPVAIKMMLSGAHSSAHELARFRSEVELAARFECPTIVHIHDFGEHDGIPYCVLEYVEGGSLAQKLAGRPLPAEEAASLAETLASAVHYAHQRHVIHRDLKPTNILLAADGQPKIADFGLAKKLDETNAQTGSGAVLGTPSYMAPEQARGESKTVGPATDVYGLGAILYEMLTGRPPFQGQTRIDTLLQVIEDKPMPPSLVNPGVPHDLEAICLRCLQKDSQNRYPTAAGLAEELRRFLAGEALSTPASYFYSGSLHRFAHRKPFLSLAVLIVMFNLMGSTFNQSYMLLNIIGSRANDAQTTAFFQVVGFYNPIAYVSVFSLFLWSRWPLAHCREQLRVNQAVSPERLKTCQRSLLNFPTYWISVNASFWLGGCLIFPLGIGMLGGWENWSLLLLRFVTSFGIAALLASIQLFFVLEAFVIAVLVPEFFPNNDQREVLGAIRIPASWRPILFWAATVALPMLPVITVSLSADLLDHDRRTFRSWLLLLAVLSTVYSGLTSVIVNWLRSFSSWKRMS